MSSGPVGEAGAPELAAERPTLRRLIYALFGATLVAVAFPRALAIPVGGTLVQASDLLCLLTVLVWSVGLARREVALRWHPAYGALAAYFVIAAVSIAVSADPKHGVVKLVALAYLSTIAVITRSLVTNEASFRAVALPWMAGWGVTVATFVASAVLFYLGVNTREQNPLLTGYYNMPVGPYPRITGLFLNPNMAANYLIVGTFVFLAALPYLDRRWSRRAAVVVGLACLGTLFSLSAGFGGLALAVGIWWWFTSARLGVRRPAREGLVLLAGIGAAAALALATILLLVPAGHGDLALGPVDLQVARSGRVVAWTGAVETVRDNPILGRGYGSLVSWVDHPRAHQLMDNYGSWDPELSKPAWMEAHSVFLNVAGQTGLLGVAAFITFYAWVLLGLWKGAQEKDARGWICRALLAGHLGSVLYHGAFAAIEDARQTWFLIGLSLAAPHLTLNEPRPYAVTPRDE
jgi:O-antigen ligase